MLVCAIVYWLIASKVHEIKEKYLTIFFIAVYRTLFITQFLPYYIILLYLSILHIIWWPIYEVDNKVGVFFTYQDCLFCPCFAITPNYHVAENKVQP